MLVPSAEPQTGEGGVGGPLDAPFKLPASASNVRAYGPVWSRKPSNTTTVYVPLPGSGLEMQILGPAHKNPPFSSTLFPVGSNSPIRRSAETDPTNVSPTTSPLIASNEKLSLSAKSSI